MSSRASLKRLHKRVQRKAKQLLGRILAMLRPDIVRKIEAGGIDAYLSHFRESSLAERLILESVLARREARGETVKLAQSHAAYWSSSTALEFHGRSGQRFETGFLGPHYPLVEAFKEVLDGAPYHTLCEIGCGSGDAINYFAKHRPELRSLIGLDLSPEQVRRNRQRYADPRLQFVAADATVWVSENIRSGMAFLTYGGVLEYFPEPALEKMLRVIAAHPPACFAIVEPIAPDFDLESEAHSRLFGGEMSFSHNYPLAFARAGFRVRWQGEVPRARYLMLVASAIEEPDLD